MVMCNSTHMSALAMTAAAIAQINEALSALRAKLSTASFQLHITAFGQGGARLVQLWNLHKTPPTLAAVEQVLMQIGGAT
jgi:hypothetical protein